MIGGKKYYASFWALLAPASKSATALALNVTATNPTYTASQGAFGASKTYAPSTSGINSVQPLNTRTWTKVQGFFTAEPNAQYLHVGYFFTQAAGAQTTSVPGAITLTNSSAQQEANAPQFSYYYIDDIELTPAPTAGPAVTACPNGTVTIGEGCNIPGATYAWRIRGQSTVFATTLTTAVTPPTYAPSTTYELTVTLPDNSTSVSSVTVSLCPPTITGPDFI